MIVLTLSGQNPSRYYISCDDDVIGRRYDNIAEAFYINKPLNETDSVCTMFATYKGRYIDSVIVDSDTISIKNNISQFEYIDISFMFTKANGYVKNSEIKRFYFEEALRPASFTPTEPQALDDLNQLIAKAFVSATYSNGMFVFKNLTGTVVFQADVSGAPNVWAVTDSSLNYENDKVSLINTQTNLKSLQTKMQTLLFQLANETNAGLMSPATVKSISDLISRVDSLEARSVRLLYTASENPTADDIENFVKAQGYSSPYSGIAVVVDKTFHIWHAYSDVKKGLTIQVTATNNTVGTATIPWTERTEEYDMFAGTVSSTNGIALTYDLNYGYNSDFGEYLLGGTIDSYGLRNQLPDIKNTVPGIIHTDDVGNWSSLYSAGFGAIWQDDGQDTVSQFTNDVAGIIKGSNLDGKVYAEDDGTGSVKGWDELKTLVQTLLTNLNNKLDKVTTSGSRRAYGIAANGTQSTIPFAGDSYGSNSLLYREVNGDCQMQDPLNPYSIANKKYVDNKVPTIAQTTGDSTTAVMSQSAVTTQLDDKASKSELSQYVPILTGQQPSGSSDATFFYTQTPGSEQAPALMFGESGLEAETYESQPTVMIRDANHRSKIEDPVDVKDIANKQYVDNQITATLGTLNTQLEGI